MLSEGVNRVQRSSLRGKPCLENPVWRPSPANSPDTICWTLFRYTWLLGGSDTSFSKMFSLREISTKKYVFTARICRGGHTKTSQTSLQDMPENLCGLSFLLNLPESLAVSNGILFWGKLLLKVGVCFGMPLSFLLLTAL